METLLSQQNFILISGKQNKWLIWVVRTRRHQCDSGGATGVSFLMWWAYLAKVQGQCGCLSGLNSLLALWFAPTEELAPRALSITVLEWTGTEIKGKSNSFLGWCLVVLWVSKKNWKSNLKHLSSVTSFYSRQNWCSMVTKTELYLDVLQSVMACLPLLLIFLFTHFPMLLEHPSLNSCHLNELYVVFIANSIGVADNTLCLTFLSIWLWTFWSSSSLGTISEYAFYSSLFLDKRTWSRQWTPGQIWVQCVLSLPIKQTGYRVASGEAWTVGWDELLFTLTPCWWSCYPVLSLPVEVGCWRAGEGSEGQSRT